MPSIPIVASLNECICEPVSKIMESGNEEKALHTKALGRIKSLKKNTNMFSLHSDESFRGGYRQVRTGPTSRSNSTVGADY